MNINYESYKVFYSVAKNKNITKASRELMISQPGVSKSIKNLEEQIGCTLFIRNKRGVLLTEEGTLLYNELKQAFEIVDNAEHKLLEVLNLESGILSIGVSSSLTREYLLSYIKKFHQKFPKIKIRIHTDITASLISKLRNGLIDFIILNLPFSIPHDCEVKKLMEVHDCFVASKNYIDLKNKVVSLEEFNHYPLILLSKGSNTRTFLDDFTIKYGVDLIPEMELASYSLVSEFTKIGLGIGYVTKEFVKKELKTGELFEIKTHQVIPPRYIGALYLKNKLFSRATQEFFEILKETKKEE